MYENLLDSIGFVSSVDAEVGEAMAKEHLRQQNNIELIASENFVSPAVMAAMGSNLQTNMPRVYPLSVIMAVVPMLILLRILQFSAHVKFLVQTTPTFSPTQALRLIWRLTAQ